MSLVMWNRVRTEREYSTKNVGRKRGKNTPHADLPSEFNEGEELVETAQDETFVSPNIKTSTSAVRAPHYQASNRRSAWDYKPNCISGNIP